MCRIKVWSCSIINKKSPLHKAQGTLQKKWKYFKSHKWYMTTMKQYFLGTIWHSHIQTHSDYGSIHKINKSSRHRQNLCIEESMKVDIVSSLDEELLAIDSYCVWKNLVWWRIWSLAGQLCSGGFLYTHECLSNTNWTR